MYRPAGESPPESARPRRLKLAAAGGVVAALTAVPALAGTTSLSPTSASPPACSGAGWPMYQHDLCRTGAAASDVGPTNVSTLTPHWFTPTNGSVTATPIVSGGKLFVGDDSGVFNALDAATGASAWKTTFSIHDPHQCRNDGGTSVAADQHTVSYGAFTSTAAIATVDNNTDPTVFFGGGGTLYAVDAVNGNCLWAQNLDPSNPTSAMEIESSPVVATIGGVTEVIVGSDSNESPTASGNVDPTTTSAPPGIQAFNARTGALRWKYEPENNRTVTDLHAPLGTDGCGDVWTSPAVDPGFATGRGLVVFATGNCPPSGTTGQTVEAITALYGNDGTPAWKVPFSEPDSDYTSPSYPDGGDTDFGSSPILTSVRGTAAVVEGSKSGYAYAVDEATGSRVLWSVQAAQPGELGSGPGAVGGFIGGAALGSAQPPAAAVASPAWFGASAIPAPFGGNGMTSPDTSLVCLDAGSGNPSVGTPRCDPLRAASLHAVNAATGAVLWQAPVSLPSYGAVTYSGGVVFGPSTTGFSVVAYDANTGSPLWAFPLGATVASGAAVVGPSIFLGTGITEGGQAIPGADGIWSFSLAGQ